MHVNFLPSLVDPSTGEPLELQVAAQQGDWILSGALRSSTAVYPIIRGIPRFVPAGSLHESRSFGYQWNRWPRLQFDSENIGKPMQGHTGDMFERITGAAGSLSGQLVLDIGCGPGRFIEIARRKGARVIGIDHSAAVEAAQQNFGTDPDVCIFQADALALPLNAHAVDGAYSIGAFHHTPDPAKGVEEAARVARPGSWLAVSVYGKGGYYDFPSVQFWRHVFQLLWPVAAHLPPLAYSYAAAYGLRPLASIPLVGPTLSKMARLAMPFCQLPDVRWSVLDTFDSVTPSYQSAHTPREVFDWLKGAGLSEIEPGSWGICSFHARKLEAAEPSRHEPGENLPPQEQGERAAAGERYLPH